MSLHRHRQTLSVCFRNTLQETWLSNLGSEATITARAPSSYYKSLHQHSQGLT